MRDFKSTWFAGFTGEEVGGAEKNRTERKGGKKKDSQRYLHFSVSIKLPLLIHCGGDLSSLSPRLKPQII